MPKSKIQSGGKHRGKTHSYAAGGMVSDIPVFKHGGVASAIGFDKDFHDTTFKPASSKDTTPTTRKPSPAAKPKQDTPSQKELIKEYLEGKSDPTKDERNVYRDMTGKSLPVAPLRKDEMGKIPPRVARVGDLTKKPSAEKRLQSKIAKEDQTFSISAARKAGHLYYWKETGKTTDGKPKYTKMAAVTREDLAKFKKKQTGSKEYGKGKLRDFMNWHLKKTRRK